MARLYTFEGINGSPIPELLETVAGAFEIQNNRLVAIGALPVEGFYGYTTRYTNQVGLELSNGSNTITVNGEDNASGKAGLLFRYSDNDNTLIAYIDFSSGDLLVDKIDAGVITNIGTYAIPSFDVNVDYRITTQPLNNNIDVLLDDSLVLTVVETFNQIQVKAGGYTTVTSSTMNNLTVATPVNSPPVADAGSDINDVAPATIVTLDGTGSFDVDGDILTYQWEQLSGINVTLTNPSTEQPFFTAPSLLTASVLVFQLTVDDGQANTSDTVTVNVNAFVPPVTGASDELGRDIVEETAGQKLERIGRTVVVSNASAFSTAGVIQVTYPTEEYKKSERFLSTQQNPDDENGLGYQFENLDSKEV